MLQEIFNIIGISPLVFLHWMLAISITLFVLDIFFQTEFISWISLFLFSSYFTAFIYISADIPIQWAILLFLIFLALAFLFYYGVWSRLLNPIIKGILLKKATPEQHERAKNDTGVFRIIENQYFVEWNGELWSAKTSPSSATFNDKEIVVIEKSENGIFSVIKK